MSFPVRCIHCALPIGHLRLKLFEAIQNDGPTILDNGNPSYINIFKKLKIKKLCCRKMLISFIDISQFIQSTKRIT